MIRKVIIVLNGLESGRLAKETEMVNWNGEGKEGFQGWSSGLRLVVRR